MPNAIINTGIGSSRQYVSVTRPSVNWADANYADTDTETTYDTKATQILLE